MVAKGNVEVSTRMTYEEREAMYMKGKQEAMKKALGGAPSWRVGTNLPLVPPIGLGTWKLSGEV